MNPIQDLLAQIEAHPDSRDSLISEFRDSHALPIIQPNEVTFVYFGDDSTQQVALQHWLHGLEAQQTLEQIEDSAVFWQTLSLPDNARIEYQFLVHTKRDITAIMDPRNPMHTQSFHSVCTMSQYKEPTWTIHRSDTPPGSIETWDLFSEIFAETKSISVYLPHEYQSQKKYAVLICLDGDEYIHNGGLKVVLDNLMHHHEMLPTIVVLLNSADRSKELAANTHFSSFIHDELFPALQDRYRIANNPDQRGIMGAGLGAVAALHTHWRHPNLFGKLLLQAGRFYFTDIGEHEWGDDWNPVVDFINGYRENPETPPSIFLSCGVFDACIYYNRTMAHLWTSHDTNLKYIESNDGHNWVAWRDQLRAGLTWAFPGHLRMIYN